MFDKARESRRLRSAVPAREEIPLLDLKLTTAWVRALTKKLPHLREAVEPYVLVGKEKVGDAYASLVKVLATQKEAFEDRLAEKKAQKATQPKR